MKFGRIFQARITGVYDRPLDFGYQREAFLKSMSRFARSTVVAVVVQVYHKVRTIQQNKYYWAVIVDMLAEHCGMTDEEMHESLKDKFLSIYDPAIDLKRIRSTTELNTMEFIEYNERIKRWASEFFGLVIPDPKTVFSWSDNPIFKSLPAPDPKKSKVSQKQLPYKAPTDIDDLLD